MSDSRNQLYLDIYLGEFHYVWHQLRRLGVRVADLPDVTHDVFMIVQRRLGDFDTSRPVRPWLFGILYRTAADRGRRHSHSHEVLPGTTPAWDARMEGEDPGPRPDDALLDRQARLIVRAVLDSLDPRLRAVLELHDLAELPANEVAAQLGIPVKTVYTRLRLARARFAGAATSGKGMTPARGLASVA